MKFRKLIEGVEIDSLGNQLTPEQSKYFANSKVRDRNGNLLVVHHGTYNSFDSFDAGDIGFHFGTEKAAKERKDYYDDMTDGEWKVGKYYLNITNFLDMYDIADWDGSNLVAHIIESRLLDLSDDEIGYLQQIQMMGGLGMDRGHKPTAMLRKFLTDRGIDGIMYENAYEDSGSISYIAFNPEQIKSISNKTPTSSKNLNEEKSFDAPNIFDRFIGDVLKKFNSMTSEQLISYMGITPRETFDENSPMFVLPNGKIISVLDTLRKHNLENSLELYHSSLSSCFLFAFMDEQNYSEEERADIADNDWRLERYQLDLLDELTYKHNWARINCGTAATDGRFYCALPNELSNQQYYTLEEWLEWGYDHGKFKVLVFVTDSAIAKKFDMNGFAPLFPEDIIKSIKRFYSSGRFYESLTESLQRLASNAFITDSPYQVRDLLMNKPKLYRILYDRNIDMYMIGDGNELIHWDLIKEARKQGYYASMEEFIDELGELDNYVEYGEGGQFLDDEEIESYLIYMVFSPDDEEFMLGEDGYQFRYQLPFGVMFTRDSYLEDCDLYNVVKAKSNISEEMKMDRLTEASIDQCRVLDKSESAYQSFLYVAQKLRETSVRGFTYEVDECYLDYGIGWEWTTIIATDKSGHSHQILSPRDWQRIFNTRDTEKLDEFIQFIKDDEYFQDKESKKKFDEGTWAIPDTQDKIGVVRSIMEHPISSDELNSVKDKLYNVFGDDSLFDALDEYDEDIYDYRDVIAGHIEDFLEEHGNEIDFELAKQLNDIIHDFDSFYGSDNFVITEATIHSKDGQPNALCTGMSLKVGDMVYDDASGHKLEVINKESFGSYSMNVTFLDTVTNKVDTRRVGDFSVFELAVDGDEEEAVDDDIEIEWHPIDDYFN